MVVPLATSSPSHKPAPWLGHRLQGPAGTGDARLLATDARQAGRCGDLEQAAVSLFTDRGWAVVTDQLITRQPTSNLDAILIPLTTGGFVVMVNPEPAGSPPPIAWLLAHEFAHTYFYSPGSPPSRMVTHSEAEELWCDDFADEFCGYVGRKRRSAA